MVTKMEYVEKILTNFTNLGKFIDSNPYGSGHINDTLLVRFETNGNCDRYILRKINDYVFKEPEKIIENTLNVTNHIRQKLLEAKEQNINKKVLTLLKAIDGKHYYQNGKDYWCLIHFIEGAYTVDHVDSAQQAYEAAKAYGKFQKYLYDFDTSNCHITIKDFHNLSKRIVAYNKILKHNPHNRAECAKEVIGIAEKFMFIEDEFETLLVKNLPNRITHNDTKINNIMLHKETDEGLCVVDLDTVMPGIILNDFGDMVRTFTSAASEDAKDFSKVKMRLPIFDALVKGYLGELNDFLLEDEIENLVLGSKIIVFEQAIRFLTDYLSGDVYYKVDYDLHNLNRAENQFKLLASLVEQSDKMEKIVRKYTNINNATVEKSTSKII